MLPCAVQYLPCLPPAHVVAFGPVNVAVSPFRLITANWRPCLVQRSGTGSGSLSQIALMIASGVSALLQQRDAFRPVADVDDRLRGDDAGVGIGGQHAGEREHARLHGAADFAGLRVVAEDRKRRDRRRHVVLRACRSG